MKRLTKLLIMTSLVATASIAMTAKAKTPEITKGTSIGKYAKPGAPVEITYSSERVEAGETSHVHIALSSRITTGTMQVKLKMSKNLNDLTNISKNQSLAMKKDTKAYPIDLDVSAEQDGLYYVKLIVKLNGRMRAFSVPVYIGEGQLKKKKTTIQKLPSGEKISVSHGALETIRR
jgi:spermidine/putrescine-binding protein